MNITKKEIEYIKRMIDYVEARQAILYDDENEHYQVYKSLSNKIN